MTEGPATIEQPPQAPSPVVLPRGVRRAVDAMGANVGHDWTVTELAEIAGISSRTLQRQFRIFLGKTPRDALRDLRFEHARRELLHSSSDTKVMDVALRCGFPHCGRFSIEYGRRYGETPSKTLKTVGWAKARRRRAHAVKDRADHHPAH